MAAVVQVGAWHWHQVGSFHGMALVTSSKCGVTCDVQDVGGFLTVASCIGDCAFPENPEN